MKDVSWEIIQTINKFSV